MEFEDQLAGALKQAFPNPIDFRLRARDGLVGSAERDLVVLDREYGLLLVIEVKGWDAAALEGGVFGEQFWLLRDRRRVRSPLYQAQQGLIVLLRRLPPAVLRRGQLYFLQGAMFPRLERRAAEVRGVCSGLGTRHPVWYRDALEAPDLRAAWRDEIDRCLRERAWQAHSLDALLFERIWERIAPDIPPVRIAPQLPRTDPGCTPFDTKLRQVARGFHRINGVVGSGKTTFIAAKALQVAGIDRPNPHVARASLEAATGAKVLVTTFTRSAASRLREVLDESWHQLHGLAVAPAWQERVEVQNFHRFFFDRHRQRAPDAPEAYAAMLAEGRYEAIFFDEFHNAQPGWGPYLARHLRPAKGPAQPRLFVVAFDPAQGDPRRLDALFTELEDECGASWASRTFYLDECFRVPERIGQFAMQGHRALTRQEFVPCSEGLDTVLTRALKPRFFATEPGAVLFEPVGPSAEPGARAHRAAEVHDVAALVKRLREQRGLHLDDLGLVVPPSDHGNESAQEQRYAAALQALGVAAFPLIAENRDRFYERGNAVVVATPKRLQGLELPVVLIAPDLLEYLDQPNRDYAAFYQAVTRATDTVVLIGRPDQLDRYRTFIS